MRTILAVIASVFMSIGVWAQLPDAPQPQTTPVYTDYTIHNTPSTLREPRGKKKLLIFAAVEGFAIGADAYDIRESERAFKLGYVETNGWLLCKDTEADQVSTCRPSARALYSRDLMELGIASAPSILAYIFRRPEWFYGGFAGPIVFGIKHIQGGNKGAAIR